MAFGERPNDSGILMQALFLKALTRLYRGDFAGARECSVTTGWTTITSPFTLSTSRDTGWTPRCCPSAWPT